MAIIFSRCKLESKLESEVMKCTLRIATEVVAQRSLDTCFCLGFSGRATFGFTVTHSS